MTIHACAFYTRNIRGATRMPHDVGISQNDYMCRQMLQVGFVWTSNNSGWPLPDSWTNMPPGPRPEGTVAATA